MKWIGAALLAGSLLLGRAGAWAGGKLDGGEVPPHP